MTTEQQLDFMLPLNDLLVRYCQECCSPEPADCSLIRQQAAGHPKEYWIVGRIVGSLLRCLVAGRNPTRVLEIGSFLGYSARMIVEQLSRDATFIAVDANPTHAEALCRNIGTSTTQIICADGFALLREYANDPFDLIFLDADRTHLMTYYEDLCSALAPNGILIADNALGKGRVLQPDHDWLRVSDAFNRTLGRDRRFVSVLLPLRDGLNIAVKLA